MTRVLVIDDEPAILRAMTIALEAQSYEVVVAATAKQAIAKATTTSFDLFIVDLGLPDMSGLEVIRQVRVVEPTAPILVLSAMQDIDTKVEALDLGADDYVSKPFAVPELLARIRVALRHSRQQQAGQQPLHDHMLELGSLRIDTAAREVTVRGEAVTLPRQQYRLLLYLAEHPNRVLTHRAITLAVWGEGTAVDPQSLRVAISQLRRKIELDPGTPSLIRTDLGIGYKFTPDGPDGAPA